MSESQFDRSDWRPGKHHRTQPRVRDYGGQKQAPIGLLAAAKLVGLGTDRALRCSAIAHSTGRKCRRVAVTGGSVCLLHGGAAILMRNRPYTATAHGQRIQAERAMGIERPDRRRTK
jgi:hypothetical protein